METKNLVWIIGIVAVILLISYGIFLWESIPGEYDDFAKCLTGKGSVIYGTDWCPVCQEQKRIFGKSFKYVNFVNCDYNMEKCKSEGVTRYPTWMINGTKHIGLLFFNELSKLSGCLFQ